jgi:hypothetical protein
MKQLPEFIDRSKFIAFNAYGIWRRYYELSKQLHTYTVRSTIEETDF